MRIHTPFVPPGYCFSCPDAAVFPHDNRPPRGKTILPQDEPWQGSDGKTVLSFPEKDERLPRLHVQTDSSVPYRNRFKITISLRGDLPYGRLAKSGVRYVPAAGASAFRSVFE